MKTEISLKLIEIHKLLAQSSGRLSLIIEKQAGKKGDLKEIEETILEAHTQLATLLQNIGTR